MRDLKLEIRDFGPIKNCKINIGSFNVTTGKQSSGKSTVAKSLYLFLLLKDGLGRLAFEFHHPGYLSDGKGASLNTKFKIYIHDTFEQIFGFKNSISRDGSFLRMDYTDYIYIQLIQNKSLSVSYSNKLRDFVSYLENKEGDSLEKSYNESIQKEIDEFFEMDYSPVYIPAGRSLMTIMGNQFELFYSTLNDDNKKLIDLCNQNYYLTIMRLKPLFSKALSKIWNNRYGNGVLEKAKPYYDNVLNGEYYYSNGEEYLLLKDGQKISVNVASSGQQESLWIYNILLYYTHDSIKKFYIIEEPESNLFPESQQLITKFLGLISNYDNPILINTHSPYVLGELNNMIFASTLNGKKKRKSFEIIEKNCQLEFDILRAYFVENGVLIDCMDKEIKQIDNTKLDSISGVINEEYDKLLDIARGE